MNESVNVTLAEAERMIAIPVELARHEASNLAMAGRTAEANQVIQAAVALQSRRLLEIRQSVQAPAPAPVVVQPMPAPQPPIEPRNLSEAILLHARQQHEAHTERARVGEPARDMKFGFGLKPLR